MLSPKTGDRNAVIVKPRNHAVISRLIPRRVGNEGMTDAAEGPDGQRREGNAHRDSEEQSDRQCNELRHVQLQTALQRPDDGDDENRERQRREHTRGLIGGDGNGHAGYDPDRHSQFETRTSLRCVPTVCTMPRAALPGSKTSWWSPNFEILSHAKIPIPCAR